MPHLQIYQLSLCTGCLITFWHTLYSWNDTPYWFIMLSTYVVYKKIFPWINPAIHFFKKIYFQIQINLLPRWHLLESLEQKKEIAPLLVLQMVRTIFWHIIFFCSNNNHGILLRKLFWPTVRKKILVIEKNFWNSWLKVRTIFGNRMLF